jgi:hypothetical protein
MNETLDIVETNLAKRVRFLKMARQVYDEFGDSGIQISKRKHPDWVEMAIYITDNVDFGHVIPQFVDVNQSHVLDWLQYNVLNKMNPWRYYPNP